MIKVLQLIGVAVLCAAAFGWGRVYECYTSRIQVFGTPVEELDESDNTAELIIKRPDGTMIAAEIDPKSNISNVVYGVINKFTISGRGVIIKVDPKPEIEISVNKKE